MATPSATRRVRPPLWACSLSANPYSSPGPSALRELRPCILPLLAPGRATMPDALYCAALRRTLFRVVRRTSPVYVWRQHRPNIQEGFLVETLGERARDLTEGIAREESEQFKIDARDFLSARGARRDHGDSDRPADGRPLRRRRDRQSQFPYAGALGEVHKRDLTGRHP